MLAVAVDHVGHGVAKEVVNLVVAIGVIGEVLLRGHFGEFLLGRDREGPDAFLGNTEMPSRADVGDAVQSAGHVFEIALRVMGGDFGDVGLFFGL